MADMGKTKKQLIEELTELRQRVSELEALDSESKKVKQKLELAQKYAEDIINCSLDMIIAVDKDRKIIEFNKAAEETFGYTRKEVLGKHVQVLYGDPEEGSKLNKTVNVAGRSIAEVTNKRKNGETFPGLIFSSRLYDTDGEFVGFMGISRDITEQKRAEEELNRYRIHLEELVRERTAELTKANEELQLEISRRKLAEEELAAEKERLAVTLRSIGDGVIATDIEGRIVLINKAAEMLIGWSEEEVIGEPLCEVFRTIYERTRKPCENPIGMALKKGRMIELTNHAILIDRHGTERIIVDSGAPICDRSGNVIGVVLVFRDVTEKRRMQEEAQRIERLESVGVLAGGIAHDFKNFLTAILANISLAKVECEGADVIERLTEAEKASIRAQNLTEQLQAFAKGRSPILKSTTISELVKDSVIFALRGSTVRWEFSIPDDVWQAEIEETQISQVINNIAMNAKQAMPEGGIVHVSAENIIVAAEDNLPLEAGEYIKISIQDQGTGIPKEHLQKIFEPYFTTKKKGSGLGLANSYSIIKNHGGHITVQSRVNVGTTFFIYLPATPEQAAAEAEEQAEVPIMGTGKILVMDDEESIRKITCEILRNIGYGVTAAEDGAEAVELYEKARKSREPFDAVIMDLTVAGGMGGMEAIQQLIQIDPGVKAIASSGHSRNSLITEFARYGFRAFINKPYGIKSLSDKIHSVLNGFS